ncbi:MAG TPA: HU family DNA-binding protein [Candidatus Rubrimentiphilum sp.]|nr:HU family DNA-binding protein [Candidatus Rubrimentiphilum sp.]
MTKAEIVDSVATESEMTRRQATEIVDLILDEITSALQKGNEVALTPFGRFKVRHRKAREGRNPKTGATIKIPARKVPAFVPGKALKEAVAGGRGGGSKKGGAKRRKR